MKILSLTILIILLNSCSTLNLTLPDRWTYVIEQGGDHSVGFNYIVLNKKIEGEFMFEKNCVYKFFTQDSTDANKLIGLWKNADSARFGWHCVDSTFHVYPYLHYGKDRINDWDKPMLVVKPLQWIYFKISIQGGEAEFILDDMVGKRMVRRYPIHDPTISLTTLLRFYFGGTTKCPHLMELNVRFYK